MLHHNIFSVGLNKYDLTQSLRFCDRDAALFSDTLASTSQATVREAHIVGTGSNVAGFTDEDFLALLDRIRSFSAGPDDSVVLYFAGHGFERNGRDYIALSNTNIDIAAHAVPVDSVVAALRQTSARVALLVIDACRLTASRAGTRFGEETRSLAQKQGIITILGCSPGEVCWESEHLGESGHGLFTYVLASLMREEGRLVPALADPLLRVRVRAECQRLGFPTQTPEIASSSVSSFAIDLLTGRDFELAPRTKRLVLIAGPPNAGKSTIGPRVSKMLGFAPTEMSSYAYARLRAAREGENYVGTMQQFMEDVVWRDGEYDAIAKDLLASQHGVSELVVGGPRRPEEVETLRASGFEVVPFYLYSSSDIRYLRHIQASDAERRQNVGLPEFIQRDFIEYSWGLPMIGRMSECDLVINVQDKIHVAVDEITSMLVRRWAK